MFEYKKCVPHSVLPRVEVCPEALRVAGEVTEFIQREFVRVESVRLVSAFGFDRGAETMLALM